MRKAKVRPPRELSAPVKACLDALRDSGLGRYVSLGGAFALAFFHEFRSTKDVDAWWSADANEDARRQVVELLKATLQPFGQVEVRGFGDVVSVDLQEQGKTVFSFQIANRSAQLRPTLLSPWKPVRLDAFEDLVASKMTALVQRGVPRDFIDIYELCDQGLTTVAECWKLWQAREERRGVEQVDLERAKSAVRVHLSRIERIRPLSSIQDTEQRRKAEHLRAWFKNEFLK